ncbi:CP family cyanate transporter-like MFS transporter [Microbacterium sp. W4I4]|uniref:MFS transporter n=1 Tax=Microbacterium sp. W4I4 TaxID=3042295 RepID=UPI00277F3B2B|nr:MFS transporter [Microbacterium sp. W4I4]MDQ0614228.1 CP family cyanate transporter-like MFS transporter [Microbacterium sp. W4I4]
MTSLSARPLWRGRALAVLGILLCAFSLRSAVASLSPMLDLIEHDFPLAPAVVGLIGAAPPVCFAVFGLVTPLLERWLGLERLTVVALATITVGLVLRGTVGDSTGLLLTTALIFAGVGMGNILMPPLVKKFFPDRLGLMMTLYTSAMAVSTFVPPLIAVPVADAAGWRFSIALWGVFALAGVIPWVLMLLRGATSGFSAPETRAADAEESPYTRESSPASEPMTGPIPTTPANRRLFGRLARIPLVWALSATFATSSTMAYVSFAWLPAVFIDIGGVDAATAGLLLSLFGTVALPASLLVPVLVVRMQATRPLVLFGSIGGTIGLAGLILAPAPGLLVLWTVLFGLNGVLFPLALVLISIRARTPETAVVLSSFVQSVGYTVAAVFPVLFGVLHAMSGSWTWSLLLVAAVLLAVIPAGMIAGRRRTVEDEWESRHGAW